jgi:hypothetical protein
MTPRIVIDSSVQDQQLPAGFSITPYHEEPPPGRAGTDRSGLDRFRVGARLAAAGLAVGAAWANVLVQTSRLPGSDGDPFGPGFIRYGFNGWGRASLKASADLAFSEDPTNGPNFGVLLCIAAAALLVAAATDWLPGRLRWQPTGRPLAALAAPFLLAVALCEVLTALPYGQGSEVLTSHVRIGPSPWLVAAGCLLAALSCLPGSSAPHSRHSTGQYSGSA